MIRLWRPELCAVFLISILLPLTGYAADRPATAADLILMRWAGIQNPTVGMMWNPADPNSGQLVGETKMWLANHATRNSNISCMTADFAQKLKTFMEAVPGGPPKITDGYRSPQAQANLPAGSTRAGPCQSYHNYGLGADFNETPPSTIAWMRANAGAYGIRTIGTWDPAHFQINAPLPPRNMCGQCATDGGNGVLPGTGGGTTPTQSFMSGLQSLFAPKPAPPPPPPTNAPLSSQPTNAFNPTSVNTPPATITPTDSRNSTTGPAVAGLIEALAEPTRAPTVTGDGAPLALNATLSDTSHVTSPNDVPQASPTYYPATVGAPSTFTSDDLANSPRQAYAPKPADTFALRTLENLKQVLLKVIAYLRPFGGLGATAQQGSLYRE